MKISRTIMSLAVACVSLSAAGAWAQTTSPAPLAGTIVDSMDKMEQVLKAWSVERQVVGTSVINDNGDTIGEVKDVLIAPDGSASYGIVGVGGFLGIGEKYVAVPVSQVRYSAGSFILPGVTKEALESAPAFKYAK